MQYALVAGAVVLLTLVRLGLDPVLGNHAPFVPHLIGLFFIAFAVARGPYIAAAVLALVLATTFFLEPRGAPMVSGEGVVYIVIFAVVAAVIPVVAWPARAAHQRAVRDRRLARKSEERFRLALAHSPVVVFTTDAELRTTWIYNPHRHLLPGEIIGRRADELLSRGGDEIVQMQRETLETGQPRRRSVATTIGGERIVYDLRVEPIRDESGAVIGTAGTASDVTDRARMEEDLRSAQQRAALLWRHCSIACEAGKMGEWSWDLEKDSMEWSAAMQRVMGLPAESNEPAVLRAEDGFVLVHADDRRRACDLADALREQDQEYILTVRIVEGHADDGRPQGLRWVELRGRYSCDENNQRIITGVALDVTDHHLAEEALSHRNADLLRSNEDLEDFTHVVSHDLKEPLRGISNYATYVLEDDGPSLSTQSRERIEIIRRLAGRLTDSLNALLQYSRVGRTEMGIRDCALAQVVASAVERLGPWLIEQHATVEIDPELPQVRCDAVRIAEVFINLIANGVKYNNAPQKHVRVGARDGGVVFVQDNGIGVPERHATEIFAMFRRLHTRDAYGGGTGSGLSIARKIVERHGGRIWVESLPGEGSTFCFTLAKETPATTPGGRIRSDSSAVNNPRPCCGAA